MKINYIEDFCTYLVNVGKYPKNQLVHFTIKSRGITCDGIKVIDKPKNGRVIQAFALMSDIVRNMHHVYPFYRTTKWGENNGSLYPSCSIATLDGRGDWKIYDANETKYQRDENSYIDFEKAKLRYEKRINAAPVIELRKKTRAASWSMAGILALYFCLGRAIPSINLPLGGDIVSLFVLIVVLVLLPILIPFIKGVSIFGFDVLFDRE